MLDSHSSKRGMEGLSVSGVLPEYRGKLMRDFWGPYEELGTTQRRLKASRWRDSRFILRAGIHFLPGRFQLEVQNSQLEALTEQSR